MELSINNQKVSFELDNEKNAFDIIKGVDKYGQTNNPKQFITAIYIDGKEYSYANENGLSSIDIKNINNISVETNDIVGLSISSINQILFYLESLKKLFEDNKWSNTYDKIDDSLEWINSGIKQIISIFSSKGLKLITQHEIFTKKFNAFKKIILKLSEKDFPLSDDLINEISEKITNLQENMQIIQIIIDNSYIIPTKDELYDKITFVISNIKDIVPHLEEVSTQFQSGEDEKAMKVVQKLGVILENTIELFVILSESFKIDLNLYSEDESFEEFFTLVTEQLKELMESIENEDTVMIGDLLEYEFTPLVEKICKIFNDILTKNFKDVN